MLDYEELLALASKRERAGARSGIKRSGSGILSKLKEKVRPGWACFKAA